MFGPTIVKSVQWIFISKCLEGKTMVSNEQKVIAIDTAMVEAQAELIKSFLSISEYQVWLAYTYCAFINFELF